MTDKRLDIIIFGATGFTGKYAVQEAIKLCNSNQFTWGIAGRNEERLQKVMKNHAPDFGNIPTIIADIKNNDSLKSMTQKCKIIVNCCGPYRFYGEPVVKSCIETKTHYVDISGEPQFIEMMQFRYNKAAQQAGVYIISACGFDSIPCDLGVIFVQKNFNGNVNSIETYLTSWVDGKSEGAALHYGTWKSAVYGVAHASELRDLRNKLYPQKLPRFQPKLMSRGIVHYSEISNGWSLPFPGADRSVVYRSQRFLNEKKNIRPAQVQTYVSFKSLTSVVSITCVSIVFALMTRCKWGRYLLLKYPRFFSGGLASHEGPKPEVMARTHFSITLKADGWKDKLADPTDKHVNSPDKKLIARVSGINPGYGATCTMLLVSAIMILRESDKMPDNGGVLPPGAAFENTSMIQLLQDNGVNFEILTTSEQ